MDRRDLASVFRERLKALLAEEESKAGFLTDAGLDRSALSQFLDPASDRLPRAETLRRIAAARGVSVDWLLSLENAPEGRQQVASSVQIESELATDGSSTLARWHREAAGQKLRYVPSALPDMLAIGVETPSATGSEKSVAHGLKFGPPLPEEQNGGRARTGGAENVLHGVQLADMDVEIAMPLQTLQDLAQGSGLWRGVDMGICRRQLEHMARVCRDGYPALRLHLFDGSLQTSAPFTVFGRQRAAVYMGSAYLVVTASNEVRSLAKLFDDLVRHAVIGPDAVHRTLSALAEGRPDI